MKLTKKQKEFCDYYIETGNATESALRAGYSENTACAIGHENLRKPNIKEYIGSMNKELSSTRIADMQEVKEFWSEMLRNKNTDKKHRLKASEYIAKTNGAFLDKVEHSGTVTKKINIIPAKKKENKK